MNYKIFITKSCRRQGHKLPIDEVDLLRIRRSVLALKYWPDNLDGYDYEKAFGALEFKFETKNHWVRVFVHFEDERKIAWVFKVIVKKENDLSAYKISIETAMSQLRVDLEKWKKQQIELEKKSMMTVLKGGQSE